MEILRKYLYSVFIVSYLFTLCLSLGGAVFFSYLDGRLFHDGTDAATIGFTLFNFQVDWANQILYAFVVPMYVGLGAVIITLSLSFQNRRSIRSDASTTRGTLVAPRTRPSWSGGRAQTVFLIAASAVFCTIFQIQYQNDVLSLLTTPSADLFHKSDYSLSALPLYKAIFGEANIDYDIIFKNPILYWFIEKNSEEYVYNLSGYFYIFLNFVLLYFVIIVALIFLSNSFSVVNARRRIQSGFYDSFEDVSRDFADFVYSFILAKWFFIFIIMNTYIWRDSLLGNVPNINATIIAYTIIGSLILPIPNRVLEVSW